LGYPVLADWRALEIRYPFVRNQWASSKGLHYEIRIFERESANSG
jgi:hypothetical protein